MRLRGIIRLIARGAIALPLFAHGHGTEMLDARFEFEWNGAVRLTITADYSGNPMLTTEAEARDALTDALRVRFDETEHKLSELASLTMERSDQPDAESPMPRAPVDSTLKHELLRATWHWKPTVRELSFVVPEESKQTTLFWMNERGVKEHRWLMLLAKDRTPVIVLPGERTGWWIVAVVVIGLCVWCSRFRVWCSRFSVKAGRGESR
jgi:hypothetical protein